VISKNILAVPVAKHIGIIHVQSVGPDKLVGIEIMKISKNIILASRGFCSASTSRFSHYKILLTSNADS
jgi:hypothetical protein